jgi:hypothetical protein
MLFGLCHGDAVSWGATNIALGPDGTMLEGTVAEERGAREACVDLRFDTRHLEASLAEAFHVCTLPDTVDTVWKGVMESDMGFRMEPSRCMSRGPHLRLGHGLLQSGTLGAEQADRARTHDTSSGSLSTRSHGDDACVTSMGRSTNNMFACAPIAINAV